MCVCVRRCAELWEDVWSRQQSPVAGSQSVQTTWRQWRTHPGNTHTFSLHWHLTRHIRVTERLQITCDWSAWAACVSSFMFMAMMVDDVGTSTISVIFQLRSSPEWMMMYCYLCEQKGTMNTQKKSRHTAFVPGEKAFIRVGIWLKQVPVGYHRWYFYRVFLLFSSSDTRYI